jgi:predicted phosphoribosyltransferase
VPPSRRRLAERTGVGRRRRQPAYLPPPARPAPGRFLLDDTWTTGASAQSACAALRLAGARPVAIVVLGRHVAALPPAAARALAARPFRPSLCAVHARGARAGQ